MAQQHEQMMQRMEPTGSGEVYMGMTVPDETGYTAPQYQGGAGMGNTAQGNAWNGGQGGSLWMGQQGLYPGSTGISSAHAHSQRMKNPVDMEGTHDPANSAEAYQASLRSLLARNVGYFVVCTFLVGTQQHVTWQGILHTVGSDYFVLYQPDFERYISCDLYSLKFAQFHDTHSTPYCSGYQNAQGQPGWR